MTGERVDHLILTADDFGLSDAVNDAVEIAHRDGVLSAASLMVGGAASVDAVHRAKRCPRLRVGLHLVLVEGAPVLPPKHIPDLVDASGRLRTDMVGLAFAIAAHRSVRAQVAREIEAQMEAYARTGLALDHVNAHKHFHLHPMIADMILSAGSRIGMRGLRVPLEPAAVLRRAEPGDAPAGGGITAFQAHRLARKADRAGLVRADCVFGLRWSGAMTADRILGLIQQRPGRVVEIYTHPAVADAFPGHAPGYRYRDELAALCDARVRHAIDRMGTELGGYADVAVSRMLGAAEGGNRRVA